LSYTRPIGTWNYSTMYLYMSQVLKCGMHQTDLNCDIRKLDKVSSVGAFFISYSDTGSVIQDCKYTYHIYMYIHISTLTIEIFTRPIKGCVFSYKVHMIMPAFEKKDYIVLHMSVCRSVLRQACPGDNWRTLLPTDQETTPLL